jgi:hypothetical protein
LCLERHSKPGLALTVVRMVPPGHTSFLHLQQGAKSTLQLWAGPATVFSPPAAPGLGMDT